jgi:hypothetical protein
MFGRRRKLDDFASEIEAHTQLEIERLREQGLSEDDARAAARRSFGNVMHAEERFYESGGGSGGTISGTTFATPCACCASPRASPPSRS